ncbi:MAG: zinc-binding dehydrogenase [Parvibaculum sp.]|nr:zinc-binding dehydrogenase [Parvibaculum sp.]
MKKIELDAYGVPEDVARCVEAPDVGAPSPGEVVFDVIAFPVNPADIGFCRGTYRIKPPLPATPGAECAGRVREATGGAAIPLGLDAVSGEATARIAACPHDEGTVCTYGGMSGAAPAVTVADLVFRGVTFTGFMLGRFLARRTAEEIRAIYAELAEQMAKGVIHAPVDSVHAIEDIREALTKALATTPATGDVLIQAENALFLLKNFGCHD